MRLGVMQPYFFPYIGYYQLIDSVHQFIIYDDVQYSKGGWINRNRILSNGAPKYFTLPIEGKRLADKINEKYFSTKEFEKSKRKIMGQLHAAYSKAPFYQGVADFVDEVLAHDEKNVALFLANSLRKTCDFLGITTKLLISSQIQENDEGLSGQEKIIHICQARKANNYINPIGGQPLYSKDVFAAHAIELNFLKTRELNYSQFDSGFVSSLSIIDVMMFNSRSKISELMGQYDLI